MNAIYRALGISKQGVHDRLDRYLRKEEEMHQLIPIIREIREDHPNMSVRWIYERVRPRTMGRDAFYRFCGRAGFIKKQKQSPMKTTDSSGVIRFPNRIEGMELTGVDQVWVSDITYYRIMDTFFYLTFITDLWSRRIIGCSQSSSLRSEETTIPALDEAIALRGQANVKGTILHSDGGGQYYCKEFLRITENRGLSNSMAGSVYENPHAERVHRTIKHDYLYHYGPRNLGELKRMSKKANHLYNHEKPHRSLGKKTPVEFEKERKGTTRVSVIDKTKRSNNEKRMTTNKTVKGI